MMVASNHIPTISQPNITASVPENMGEREASQYGAVRGVEQRGKQDTPIGVVEQPCDRDGRDEGDDESGCELAQGLRATQIEG